MEPLTLSYIAKEMLSNDPKWIGHGNLDVRRVLDAYVMYLGRRMVRDWNNCFTYFSKDAPSDPKTDPSTQRSKMKSEVS